jgi:uncharacterized glyoxalase superfamily protein PhnB
MTKAVKVVPEGCHTVTPTLTIRGAARAIDFYKQAFGAEEVARFSGLDGKSVMHAAIRIGDSLIYLADEFPQYGSRSPQTIGGTASGIHLYVADVDATVKQAVAAGAQLTMPPADMFWGDRFAKLTDPFGHDWAVATHKEDVPLDEMERRSKEFQKQMAGQCG